MFSISLSSILTSVIILLIVSTVLRILLGCWQRNVWKIPIYKYFLYVPLMTVAGTLGARLFAYIAYPDVGGTRLYGTVIAISVCVPILAILLLIPFRDAFGFTSVATYLAIAIMKISCLIEGCCYGRSFTVAGHTLVFPSQILEILVATLLFVVFLRLSRSAYPRERLYPLFLITYGVYRYAFDWLRGSSAETAPFVLWIPAGRFFSLIILAAGILSMLLVRKCKK